MNITEMERTQLAKERTQLAIERTFLAWLRTGLVAAASGLLIIRFLSLQAGEHEVLALAGGVGLVLVGVLMFLKAAKDCYRQSKKSNLFFAIALSALALYLGIILL